ncbi:MAG: hypothetical protein MJZ66_06045 [Bacteroidales bacterium]|nr:hypothetical protein [Bacteroidales bacterium]
MKRKNLLAICCSAALLAACGGNGGGQQHQGADTADSTATLSEAKEPEVVEKASETDVECNFDMAMVLIFQDRKEVITCDSGMVSDKAARSFNKLLYDGKLYDIDFQNYQKGEGNKGNLIYASRYFDEYTGYTYKFKGGKPNFDWEADMSFVFNSNYTDTHHYAPVKNVTNQKLPQNVKDLIAQSYPKLKFNQIWAIQDIDNGTAKLYSVSFHPSNNKMLALNILEMNGKLYVEEDWGYADGWNVDDGGEYHYPQVDAFVDNDKSHVDMVWCKGAPESFCYGKLIAQGDSLYREEQACYYNYIDYNSRRQVSDYQARRVWSSFFPEENATPTHYCVMDTEKGRICFLKKGDAIAYCSFDNGYAEPRACNLDDDYQPKITFEIYQNGANVYRGGGNSYVRMVWAYNGNRCDYYEMLEGGPQLSVTKKEQYGDPVECDETELDNAMKTLHGQIDLSKLEWTEIDSEY